MGGGSGDRADWMGARAGTGQVGRGRGRGRAGCTIAEGRADKGEGGAAH